MLVIDGCSIHPFILGVDLIKVTLGQALCSIYAFPCTSLVTFDNSQVVFILFLQFLSTLALFHLFFLSDDQLLLEVHHLLVLGLQLLLIYLLTVLQDLKLRVLCCLSYIMIFVLNQSLEQLCDHVGLLLAAVEVWLYYYEYLC